MDQITCKLYPCSTKHIYKCLDILKGILTKMVNLSLRQGLSIQDWKLAIVKPFLKKTINLSTEFKSFRPIRNLSSVSKIVKKVVQNQLTDHFNRQSVIPSHQHAYRIFYSNETTILDLCNNTLINMENNENTAMVALAISAAFYTVNKKILIKVLENYFGKWDKASDVISSK